MMPPTSRSIPERIRRLGELTRDLWWTWHPTAREVFRRLDYPLWRLTAHNPVRMLPLVAAERWQRVAEDRAFLALYDEAIEGLDRARTATDTWWKRQHGHLADRPIAYFSAEFAVHQSLPIYAGGLGVLAGDHCKEASDLGIPLIGVGFKYPMGYFRQKVGADGWQIEAYERLQIEDVAVEPALAADGRPCSVSVRLAQGIVRVAVWRVNLGRVRIYLLDTDVEENSPWERELSARLYVEEHEARLRQEIVLGLAGVRALRALGHDPAVWHLNEGHAAFVVFERVREFLERGETFESALEQVRSTTLFTTHTPVAAGHDAFSFPMVEHQLISYWPPADHARNALMRLGAQDTGWGQQFNMTALALNGAGAVNAVSRRHQEVTIDLFRSNFPRAGNAVAVKAVTNGVHVPTWLAPAMAALFDRHLGPEWRDRQDDPSLWENVLSIPDEELWAARLALKGHLAAFICERCRELWAKQQVGSSQVLAAGALLDRTALTIGFGRRFAEYKRAELIFWDTARLQRLLRDPRRPVQIVFAGKAHPADDPAKRILQRIYHRALDPAFAGRIVFVDDYDLHISHFLVQGCDVWLNNPTQPMEACGTSGMKAAINGVPHLSVPDGWWVEGYTGYNGWRIEGGDGGDWPEADSLYRLLEEDIVPTYYDRDELGVPKRWLAVVKQAIRIVTPRFCARRMVRQYADEYYAPMAEGKSPGHPQAASLP
jgi:starch phosphorylase